MQHAVIISHPNAASFTASASAAYADACRALGHGTVIRDLYRMDFDPCLKPMELPFGTAELCGMTALEHVHTGGVTPDASLPFVEARLEDIRRKVTNHFGSEACH